MKKIEFIRREPKINDINSIIETVNAIIDYLKKPIVLEHVSIEREVEDYKFFNWDEVKFPYEETFTIHSLWEASDLFNKFVLSYKEMSAINTHVNKWKVVSVDIKVTEKEKKQTIIEFEDDEEIIPTLKTKTKTKKWATSRKTWKQEKKQKKSS